MAAQSPSEQITLGQHIVYFCSRFLSYALPLVFFLVTTSFYLKTYDSAQIKITFTQVGSIFILFVWITKILVEGRFPFGRKDLVYVAPFLAYLASGIVVWLHTPFKEWSLEETSRRVFYMILALVTIAEMNSSERMKRLWRWLMAAAWTAIGYGAIQYIDMRFSGNVPSGLDPFIWRGAFGPRIFSTFGNPNFYGNFLVIMTPLILASVLKGKGSIFRPVLLLVITLAMVVCIDKMTMGLFGGFDPSLRVVFAALIVALLGLFFYVSSWRVGSKTSLPAFLILFSMLFLNLYATETKGAWMGFIAAMSATLWLIFEYFLHFEEHVIAVKKYFLFLLVLGGSFCAVLVLMVIAFVLPLIRGQVDQVGFQILWIPTAVSAVIAVVMMFWLMRKPWNLKKLIYGVLIFFVISLGAGVLQFAKRRLASVSFRMFTWISTWEMVRTSPILGNGVGTFKVIYPAYRRPQIIALEGRSNTETDHAEDEYLEVWQDEGIVGFGIFLWLVLTAIVLGLKQLRWYSLLRVPDQSSKRKILDIESDPRSYEVLGLLGAFIGALMHWFVDVSIRFVSSGVFSGLLPGALVAYARSHDNPMPNEARLPYERWIRISLAVILTGALLWLRLELVPQSFIQGGYTAPGQIVFWIILAGIGIYALIELLEIGNRPEVSVRFSDQYAPINPNFFSLRILAIPVVAVACLIGIRFFGGQFFGDVHHNLAIFFSKEAIWTKSPQYDSRMMNYPPDIREKYQKVGGALDHYKEVVAKNHAFPMAHYFTGNVYNDWGSQMHGESLNARNKGDMEESLRFKQKAIDMWDKAEAAYNDTKKLAPNYVQTHHQVGLLDVKRAEQAAQWGDPVLAKKYHEEALRNFRLYKMLDPVFPANYDRIVQILLMDGKSAEAIDLYKEALYYNDVVVRSIHNRNVPDRVSAIAVSLAKLYYNQVVGNPNPFSPLLPQVTEAIKYFKLAAENDPKNIEAWKGLGFLSEKTGQHEQAQAAYKQALTLSPNDPDLKFK